MKNRYKRVIISLPNFCNIIVLGVFVDIDVSDEHQTVRREKNVHVIKCVCHFDENMKLITCLL